MAKLEAPLDGKLDLPFCYQCGTCTAVCPMGVPVRRLLRGAQLGQKDLSTGDSNLWFCSTCRLCELACPRGVKVTDIMHTMRVAAFGDRKAPPRLEKALWGVYEEGNSWGGKKAGRAKWAEGLPVRTSGKAKFILYAGCAVAYDPRLQTIARSLTEMLGLAGVDFRTLGADEKCCGDAVYQVGEEGFLEELVTANIKEFRDAGEAVITISPHCYNMFESVYPKYGEMIPVVHYTQVLADLIDKGSLKPGGDGSAPTTVTYHDPCYLGRYHGIYEEPRKILESVKGVSLVEMKDNKGNTLCCGGGGGLMWTEFEGERPSRKRVTQASDSGASVMATSCPYCVLNFEDATKTEGIGGMKVMDVSEVLRRSLGGET